MAALDSPQPARNNPEDRQAELGAFRQALTPLERFCTPVHKLGNCRYLWFKNEEAASVQRLLVNKGPQAVLERWGDERTFYRDKGGRHLPPKPDTGLADNEALQILMIVSFEPHSYHNSPNFNYFRRHGFALAEAEQLEFLLALRKAGLLALIPAKDEIQNIELSGAPITDVRCVVEWYGPTNLYGSGTVLGIGLVLNPLPEKEIELRIRVNEAGEAISVLWDAAFFETGYEGHQSESFELDAADLRALTPLLKQLGAKPPAAESAALRAIWVAYGGTSR